MNQPNAVRLSGGYAAYLDSAGSAVIRISPQGEKWEIETIHVRCTTRVSEAECRIYLGAIKDDSIIDATYSGSSGDTTNSRIYLEDGQPIFIQWTGGDVGSIVSAVVNGWRSNPIGGFRAIH